MKAEDLMIGDWVNLYDNPIKINIDDLGVIERDETYDKGVHCKPVPLTSEILEKNGFTKDSGGEELYSIDFASLIDVGYGFELFISNDEKGEFNGTKKYVHELQHALKLCGIEKEIVL